MRVETLLKQLKREFFKINSLQAVLDSLLFFLTVNLGLFLFSLQLAANVRNLPALAITTVLFFMLDFLYRARTYRLEIYEDKNPELQEILRTARDNLRKDGIVIQAMFDDLIDRSRSVTSESIIPSKKIIQKIVLVGILSFITVLSGITNFQVIQDGGSILPDPKDVVKQIQGKDKDEFELKNGSEITGEKRDIDFDEGIVNYSIESGGTTEESDINRFADPENLRLDSTPRVIRENLELAKTYNLQIREIRD